MAQVDGGGPNTPSGLDALTTFTATQTGTYVINARAFDQDATNGSTGDGVGDYTMFVKTADPNTPTYTPFYSSDSPLSSIDWGTQVARTVRNPDGDNGPRDNGTPGTGVVNNTTYNIQGKNVITYYFAKQGDVFISDDPTTAGTTENMVEARNLQDWEKQAFVNALHEYEKVADVTYIEVQSKSEADFKFIVYNGTPGAGASLLGRMSPPGENNAGQAEFNAGDVRWTEAGLQPGGFYFPTLLHEIGHGHGMAHPHDNGGHSTVMRGADGGTAGIGGGYGDFGLSQQVFTVMSYNDGWELAPYGHPSSGDLTGMNADPYGWVGTLSPLDIAVIQDKYGVNEDANTGDNTYVLKDANAVGTYYQSIWDAGGNDTIRYDGARDATIDLRAATLRYEEGGGGRVSYAYGVFGGFTIANGLTIENAIGGAGNDTLNGNGADNTLNGGLGDDIINGGAGVDTAVFNVAFSTVQISRGSAGEVIVTSGEGRDVLTGIEKFQFTDGTIVENDADQGVDDLFYYAGNRDVWGLGLDADSHYHSFGWKEGRDPNVVFSTLGYLAANKDIKALGLDPLLHYEQSGWKEGRDPSAGFDTTLYLQHNPDIAALNIDPLEHYLQFGQAEGRQTYAAIGSIITDDGFDAEYYLLSNPDVAAAGIDPYIHYMAYGWKEGRNPNAWFDDAGYLARYADVKAAGINPLAHYHQYGWKEGRDPSAHFDTQQYENHNGDVGSQQLDPLVHYLRYGAYENRSTYDDNALG